jgi:hypothetical protein
VGPSTLFWKEGDFLYFKVRNPAEESLQVSWELELLPGTLHVLAAGASECEAFPPLLESAERDAAAVAEAVKAQEGRLFTRVEATCLVGMCCSRDAIYRELHKLKQAAPGDVCLVLLSGHGVLDDNKAFLFAPSDYDKNVPGLKGISQYDLVRELCEVKCPALVFLDTCHSGAATMRVQLPETHPGIQIFASTMADDDSKAGERWANHGALVLALLEALGNRKMVSPGKGGPAHDGAGADTGLITWDDLGAYLAARLKRVTDGRQALQEISGKGPKYSGLYIASMLAPARR